MARFRLFILCLIATSGCLALSVTTASAATESNRGLPPYASVMFQLVESSYKFDVSIGWGDQKFETLIWHEIKQPFGQLPDDQVISVNQNYKYSQHFFVNGYMNLRKWFGVGLMLDYSGVSWETADYYGNGDMIGVTSNEKFVNVSMIPAIRFNYLNTKYVSFRSGLGLGLNLNTGTETDFRGRRTVIAPALYLNLIGVKASYDHFFTAVDLGGLISLWSQNEIYLLGSRLVSVSLGVQF